MRFVCVDHLVLATSSRWTPSFFFGTEDIGGAAYEMVQIGRVVKERKEAVEPKNLGGRIISYLGLENVRSETGELVAFEPRSASDIKSRSRVFRSGDVLFGRLRPELNKVYLVDGDPAEGICSGEFIVLVPDLSVVNARYIRHVIASPFVSRLVEKFRVGASLPRLAASDLLGIKIPLPPLVVQQQIAERLALMDFELRELRAKLEKLPGEQRRLLMDSVTQP